MRTRQISLFEDQRLDLQGSIELSLASLREYGQRYRHWCIAYSGGKDSSATVAFVAIKSGAVPAPESLTILYADTRMELPPLQQTAMSLLSALRDDGFDAKVVLPPIDKRFYVYMLGRGVPPPKNRFRWCTSQLKVEPMMNSLAELRQIAGEKLLMLTGVRLGESKVRDQRIAVSCGKDDGECGQGWFQTATDEAVADTLAPLLHWRLCHVYDWIYFEQDRHGYNVDDIAVIYGEDEVRTGLTKPQWRKRKASAEKRKDGQWGKNPQRMGPLTMAGRAYGLDMVLDIQYRSGMDLINEDEESRIREMWSQDIWPRKWSADDIDATVPIEAVKLDDTGVLVKQVLLV